MKPKIFLRKLLRGGNSIEDVFKMDSLSITDKGVDNTYVSKIDLTSDSFTFNEAYVNTYYLHLSIFCYYFVKQNQNLDRPQFITDSVDKIKDYVKCFVLYKILKQIIDPAVLDDDKEKYINAIKSTDAFDQFDDKTIQGVSSSNSSSLNNMKILLNAIAIIIKYSGDDNKTLIAALNNYCSNFDDLLTNEKKQTALSELLTKSQNAKATYEKSSKFLNKKMEIFEEIKREVKSKLDEYKSKFLTTMKDKDEYKLISQAKIAKVKKLAVDVIRVITKKSTSMYGTPQQIANVVKSSIDISVEDGHLGKTEMGSLINEFNKLSQDEKQDKSMMVIQDLINKKDDQSSQDFSTYYYEEYLKEEFINSYNPSTGGKKRRMKKKGGTTEEDMIAIINTFTSSLTPVANLFQRLGDISNFSEIKKKDIKDINQFSDALDSTLTQFKGKKDSVVLTEEQRFLFNQAFELRDLIQKLKKEYLLVSKTEGQKQQELFTQKMSPLIQSILEKMMSVKPLSGKIGSLPAIQSDRIKELHDDVDNDSDQPELRVIVYDPLANPELKSKINAIQEPHDELIKAYNQNPDGVIPLVAKEKEDRAKYDAIIKLVDSTDDSLVILPKDLDKDKDKLIKMVKTIQMSVIIDNGEDLLTADIVDIDDELKSLAANIKSVSAIFKRLNDPDINGIIGGTVDEAALNQLKESVSKKLKMDLNEYDKENNDNLKKKLDGYDAILKSATDITDLAQKIIEDHKTGGFRKLFYKKKRRGGDGEEAGVDPEDLAMPRIQDLETKYNKINEDIQAEITKLGRDIEDTRLFIAAYNEKSKDLQKINADGETTRNDLTGQISQAEQNKEEAIKKVENAQNDLIAGLNSKLESLKQSQNSAKTQLSNDKDELILKIKMKVTEIEKLKVLTGNMIEKAKKILEQKEKVIDAIITEKEQEITRIDKTISTKEKIISDKIAEDLAIAKKVAMEQEDRISAMRIEEAQTNELKAKKENLKNGLKAINQTKETITRDKDNLNKTANIYKEKLENANRDEILRDYELSETTNQELNKLKFSLFTKQEDLEDPKTFLNETDVDSLRNLATELFNLNTQKTPPPHTGGGGEDDEKFEKIIGSDNYITSNITIANKLYYAAKEAGIDIQFNDSGELKEDNLTIELLCDYLIEKLKNEYTLSQLPSIIKELLRKFQTTAIGELELEDIGEILGNIASHKSSIYFIYDPKHFVFGISLLIKYIDELFKKLAFKYSSGNTKLETQTNIIRNINRNTHHMDTKRKIKIDVDAEYNKRAEELSDVKQEISKIDKILKGNQITTVVPEVVPPSESSLPSTKAPQPPEVPQVSMKQMQYNNDLLKKFLGIIRLIKRNTDDDFSGEVAFLQQFSNDSLGLAEVNALIQQFNNATNMYDYPENEQLRSLLAIAHKNYNGNTLTNISLISPERHKNTNIILGGNGILVTVTVDGETLTFIKIDNQIRYVKFGNGNNVFLKLDHFDFNFVFDENDSNNSKETINLEKPQDYDEEKDYRSADKYYILYKKYFKSNDFGLDIEDTDFISFIKTLLTKTTLRSINSSIKTEKENKPSKLMLFDKLGLLIWIHGGNATNLSESNITQSVNYDFINYRKTLFLIDNADNKVIGIKLSTDDNNKIYLLFPKPFISNLNLQYFEDDKIGGAPNTEKQNNIFNAYIIMVMNKIMELGEADLKDFTSKAQIAVQA